MTQWQKPKIDWYGAYNGKHIYAGDRFNLEDYNRLNNNLKVLHELANNLWPDFNIKDNKTKDLSDYIYADEINIIEYNIDKINSSTFNLKIGDKKTYYPNGYFIDFNELNRLEKAMLLIYNYLTNQCDGARHFCWNFGDRGGEL